MIRKLTVSSMIRRESICDNLPEPFRLEEKFKQNLNILILQKYREAALKFGKEYADKLILKFQKEAESNSNEFKNKFEILSSSICLDGQTVGRDAVKKYIYLKLKQIIIQGEQSFTSKS